MKKEYYKPQLECMVVAVGQIMTDSPVGSTDTGNGETGGSITEAPARALYL